MLRRPRGSPATLVSTAALGGHILELSVELKEDEHYDYQ